MKDRPHIVLVKTVARLAWAAELWLRRRLLSRWRRRFWRLSGECNACGACCVEPSIRASVLVWYVPIVRRLFLAWQRRVNGFELARTEAE